MYKLSRKIRICDDTWNASISEVVSRYGNIVILLCVLHTCIHTGCQEPTTIVSFSIL